MVSIEQFLEAVAAEFGPEACPNRLPSATNSITGAFSATDFGQFRQAFSHRLRRLNRLYSEPGRNRKELCDLLRRLVKPTGWQDAYAELAALDFLLQPNMADCPAPPRAS